MMAKITLIPAKAYLKYWIKAARVYRPNLIRRADFSRRQFSKDSILIILFKKINKIPLFPINRFLYWIFHFPPCNGALKKLMFI
jgi:hypothetical protein